MTKLGDICSYRSESITVEEASSLPVYLSTESMQPNRGPVSPSALPANGKVKHFHAGDTLVSNIRPYFKKIWHAKTDGTCSNDILIFEPNSCLADYLYWILNDDKFFDYITKTAKGTKMPRGDKNAIMEYKVRVPSDDTQSSICSVMQSIQSKVEINCQINDYLEQTCQALFDRFDSDENNPFVYVSEVASVNPRRSIRKGEEALCVEMADLSTSGSFPSGWRLRTYNGGMKFVNGDTIMARITPCLENGKTGFINFLDEGQTAFGSTEYIVISTKGELPPEYFYFLARNREFVAYAVAHMNGSSGRQRVSGSDIERYAIRKPSMKQLAEFELVAGPAMETILANSLENMKLAELRDALLPKLISGEIDVSRIELPTLPNNHLFADWRLSSDR